ncbi:MAG: hypothetical protein [Caudoviricetes sp.]|nr:MAG: hypothetical protein [Caudoviricetes sp.]
MITLQLDSLGCADLVALDCLDDLGRRTGQKKHLINVRQAALRCLCDLLARHALFIASRQECTTDLDWLQLELAVAADRTKFALATAAIELEHGNVAVEARLNVSVLAVSSDPAMTIHQLHFAAFRVNPDLYRRNRLASDQSTNDGLHVIAKLVVIGAHVEAINDLDVIQASTEAINLLDDFFSGEGAKRINHVINPKSLRKDQQP